MDVNEELKFLGKFTKKKSRGGAGREGYNRRYNVQKGIVQY